MRNERPSLTAVAVAFGRGLGTEGDAPDPLAQRLLPRPAAALLNAVTRLDARPWPARLLTRSLTLGMVDHVCLRTAAIDRVLLDALQRSCRQVVILGAGLDARAWRIDELANIPVFEVDHPSTQAGKRHRCAELPSARADLHFVDVDFEGQDLGARLGDAGHQSDVPTLWIWEGVTPYLQRAAIDNTLEKVAARSAIGSKLVMTYALPGRGRLPALAFATSLLFRALGESLRTTMTPEQAGQLLRRHGFAVTSDTDARDWTAFAPGSASLAWPFRQERLAVATRA